MKQTDNYYVFSQFPDKIIQAVSTRYYGSIKDKGGFNKENLKKFAASLDVYEKDIIFPRQGHTGNVAVINRHPGKPEEVIDGLVTKDKLFLGVVTADCLPIMFFDPKEQIAGIVHAGYKGLLNGVLENMISTFINLGSNTKNIFVGIGPGIGVCCYSVSLERIKKFLELYSECRNIYQKKGDKFFLDLVSIAEYVLTNKGIRQSHIEKANICTKDNRDKFYSFRGDSKESFGEFASIIGI